MQQSYSTIAVKYVASIPALDGLGALQELQQEGAVHLGRAAAATRSAGGEVNVYPVASEPIIRGTVSFGIGSFILGFVLRRSMRCALMLALVGVALSIVKSWISTQALSLALPTLAKNESLLYLQIADAQWPAFASEMKPYLDQGNVVVRTIDPGHAALADILGVSAQKTPPTQKAAAPFVDEVVERAANQAEDDLTMIMGIGPVFAERLAQGGVSTFDQLAAMNVDELAQITGQPASLISRYDWIGQAGERTGSTAA